MALSGRDKTFAFQNCRDMLDKLKREINRYARVDGQDVEAMKDLAFNIAVTGWHLCDWVFNCCANPEASADSLATCIAHGDALLGFSYFDEGGMVELGDLDREKLRLEVEKLRFERQKLAIEVAFKRRDATSPRRNLLRDLLGNPIALAIVGGALMSAE